MTFKPEKTEQSMNSGLETTERPENGILETRI